MTFLFLFIPRLFIATVGVLLIVNYGFGPLSFELQAVILSILVLILALPHGALDHKLAEATGLVNSPMKLVLFFTAYLSLSMIGFIFWILFPLASLLFFLLISAWHFGSDFSKFSSSHLFSIIPGIALLTGPFVFYQNDVAQIFNIFVEQDNAVLLSVVGQYMAYGFVPLAVIIASLKLTVSFDERLEFMTTLSAGLLLPPLMFLVVFFCLSHSLKHLSILYFTLKFKTIKAFLYALLPLTILSYIFLGIIALNYGGTTLVDLSLKSVIILLSVLTIPHMLLVEYWKYQSRKVT